MNFYLWFTMFNKVPIFHFQKHSDLIVSNTLFDCNHFYSCNSISYDSLVFECIAEVGGVRRFISYGQV